MTLINLPLLLIATSLTFTVGIYYGLQTKKHPEFFWTYLIVGLIFTSPLMFGGYTWYDEFYAAGFLLAYHSTNTKKGARPSYIVFKAFCLYMLIQSLRGMIFFSQYSFVGCLIKIRWTFFFIMVFWFFMKNASSKNYDLFDANLPYNLTKAGLLFNIIYLTFGLIAISTTGSTAFTQTAMISDEYRIGTSPFLAIFGATGYVVSVYIVFVPAALITIKNNLQGRAYIGWLTVVLSFMTQMLYNSRSGILLCLIFFGLFMLQFGLRSNVIKGMLFFIPLVGFALIFQLYFNEVRPEAMVEDMLNTLYLSDRTEHDQSLQDIDRKIWNASAISALSDNAINFLFGWGLRTSGYIVAPYVYDDFLAARGTAIWKEDVGTPGFAALAVDTGVIGLVLISLIVVFCVMKMRKLNNRVELFIFFAPIAFILQLFVMNISDVLLMYIAIMPCGLYLILARKKKTLRANIKSANNPGFPWVTAFILLVTG